MRVSDSLCKVPPSITPLNGVLDVTVGFLSHVLRARWGALGKKTLWNWKVWQKMEALDLPIRGLTQIQIIALFGSLVALLKRNLLLQRARSITNCLNILHNKGRRLEELKKRRE